LLKNKDPNPLNFFEIRRASIAPPYFEYIVLPTRYNLENTLVKWIEQNLKGKFYVGRAIVLNSEDSADSVTKVGFEEVKELSYFTLACPFLKYN
tara:strand:+ start:409 stop:690 length:282 start_codon:yes stop_codon:yes gene_type:complete